MKYFKEYKFIIDKITKWVENEYWEKEIAYNEIVWKWFYLYEENKVDKNEDQDAYDITLMLDIDLPLKSIVKRIETIKWDVVDEGRYIILKKKEIRDFWWELWYLEYKAKKIW